MFFSCSPPRLKYKTNFLLCDVGFETEILCILCVYAVTKLYPALDASDWKHWILQVMLKDVTLQRFTGKQLIHQWCCSSLWDSWIAQRNGHSSAEPEFSRENEDKDLLCAGTVLFKLLCPVSHPTVQKCRFYPVLYWPRLCISGQPSCNFPLFSNPTCF